jgi:membrane protease YdiL (CAAX protease family)
LTAPRSAFPSRSPFDVLRTRGLVAQLILVSAAVVLLFDAFFVRSGTAMSSRAARLTALLVYLSVLAVLALRAWRARLDWRALFGPPISRELLPLLGVVAPVALLTLGAGIALYIPLSYVAPRFVERVVLEGSALFDARTIVDWLELVLVGVIAAPLVEELFFRGFLLHRFARRWGTPTAVVASSALFAVLHGEWIGHFLFGVAMAALYLRTGRLWMPIAAHAINNGVVAVFTLADVLRRAPPETTTLADLRAEWPMALTALVAGALLLWWYVTRWWPNGSWRAVLRGPTPYDSASRRPYDSPSHDDVKGDPRVA